MPETAPTGVSVLLFLFYETEAETERSDKVLGQIEAETERSDRVLGHEMVN